MRAACYLFIMALALAAWANKVSRRIASRARLIPGRDLLISRPLTAGGTRFITILQVIMTPITPILTIRDPYASFAVTSLALQDTLPATVETAHLTACLALLAIHELRTLLPLAVALGTSDVTRIVAVTTLLSGRFGFVLAVGSLAEKQRERDDRYTTHTNDSH